VHHLEGIISKRASAPYRGGRGTDWLKVKCVKEQEFVIGGFTEPTGSRAGIGALHVGAYEGDRLVYRGKVGTGFTDAVLRELRRRLDDLEQESMPFADGPVGAAARTAHWVDPVLVARVRFTDITDDGRLRHPSFEGLREDKRAREVTLEKPLEAGAKGDEAVATGKRSAKKTGRPSSTRSARNPAKATLTRGSGKSATGGRVKGARARAERTRPSGSARCD
jgi:bifunctional non-homologous end joining protein LigD